MMTDTPNSNLARLLPNRRWLAKAWNTWVRLPLRYPRAGAQHWATRKAGEGHGPDKFMQLQPSSHVMVEEVAARASGPDAPILDLGCNVGRHLDALLKRGFRNLHGVDVQVTALESMGQVFPELGPVVQTQCATFEDYLPRVPARFFEVVFTHGATIELVPPSFPICGEMARVSERWVVLLINENGHSFPRLWEVEFRRAGFLLTKLLRPAVEGGTTSLLVFRRIVD